jgi:peptidoglycan/LPS O-acetylase OafA/YrhL
MICRLAIAHFATGIVSLRYLTPCCLDALAVGGLVAHVKHYRGSLAVGRLAWWLAAIGFLGLVFSTIPLARLTNPADAHRVGHTFLVVFYGAIVAWAALGFRWLPGQILTFAPMRYLGKISYGLYVYHYFAPYIMQAAARHFGWDSLLQSTPALLAAYTVFSVVVSVLSWHLYELPLNRLKRHFAYPSRSKAEVPASGALA